MLNLESRLNSIWKLPLQGVQIVLIKVQVSGDCEQVISYAGLSRCPNGHHRGHTINGDTHIHTSSLPRYSV